MSNFRVGNTARDTWHLQQVTPLETGYSILIGLRAVTQEDLCSPIEITLEEGIPGSGLRILLLVPPMVINFENGASERPVSFFVWDSRDAYSNRNFCG